MFRAFDIKLLSPSLLREFEDQGRGIFQNQKQQVKRYLEKYFNKNGELEG